MPQLGRIGGQVLADNLLRAGVDLAFETDLLYLDVINQRIGIKASTPSSVFEVPGLINTTDILVDTQADIGNLRLIAPDTISTIVGGIDVFINGGVIFHDRLRTDNLTLDDNVISSSSNSNIVFDPSGTGTVELNANTDITGNLTVSGNITIPGNLSKQGSLILGDETIDTVTVNTDFTQSIIAGVDNTFALGAEAGDSTARRWADLYVNQWQSISNGTWPGSGIESPFITVSSQLVLNGNINKIQTIQSNDDVFLNPFTGVTHIENLKWQINDITNLSNTAMILVSTGTGYYNFTGTNGFVVPAGDNSQRRISPEVGETRWNTEEGYLECFDGTIFEKATGGGQVVNDALMEELAFVANMVMA